MYESDLYNPVLKKDDSSEEREVLELLLHYSLFRKKGGSWEPAKSIAGELWQRFQSFQGILDASYDELQMVDGMAEETAGLLKAVKKSINLYLKKRLTRRKKISSTKILLDFCDSTLSEGKDEQFMTIFLNSQNEMINYEVIQNGTVDHVYVYPRKVMERALYNRASALIFVHNHPGGNSEPSYDDIAITTKLKQAAEIFDIKIHDHIIITKNDFFSFLDNNLL